jgi:hypothetical protein
VRAEHDQARVVLVGELAIALPGRGLLDLGALGAEPAASASAAPARGLRGRGPDVGDLAPRRTGARGGQEADVEGLPHGHAPALRRRRPAGGRLGDRLLGQLAAVVGEDDGADPLEPLMTAPGRRRGAGVSRVS